MANALRRPVRAGNCPAGAFCRLGVLRGLSRRTLDEPHEPLLAVNHDFASHPAVFEPLVACSHESLGFRCRHRPCTSLAIPARPWTGRAPNVDQLWVPCEPDDRHFRNLPEQHGLGNPRYRAFFGRTPPPTPVPAHSGHGIRFPPMTSMLDLLREWWTVLPPCSAGIRERATKCPERGSLPKPVR